MDPGVNRLPAGGVSTSAVPHTESANIEVLRENTPFMLAVLAIALFAMFHPAFAGTDATFNTAFTKFQGFLEGSGGKIITLISLVGGLVGLASGRFSIAQIAIPVGVGVGVGTGIPIVTSTITALI